MADDSGKQGKVSNLEQLLGRIDDAARGSDEVSLRMVVQAFGKRSFAPLLLLAGVITAAPVIGDIPGVPTMMGLFVFLVAGQLMFYPHHLWLPKWLMSRSISNSKISKTMGWLRRPARFIDRLLKPRLTFMTGRAGSYVIAGTCLLIALAMPPMEIVPFTANGAGLALTAFGLALVAHDGLVALLAVAFTLITLGLTLYGLI